MYKVKKSQTRLQFDMTLLKVELLATPWYMFLRRGRLRVSIFEKAKEYNGLKLFEEYLVRREFQIMQANKVLDLISKEKL